MERRILSWSEWRNKYYSLDLSGQFYCLSLNVKLLTLYFWAFSDSRNWFLVSRYKTNGTSPAFLLFLGSLMAVAADRCDFYTLLLVTPFQAVPKTSQEEGCSLQQTVEILMPQTEMSNSGDRNYYWKCVQLGETEENLARQYLQ